MGEAESLIFFQKRIKVMFSYTWEKTLSKVIKELHKLFLREENMSDKLTVKIHTKGAKGGTKALSLLRRLEAGHLTGISPIRGKASQKPHILFHKGTLP